jgi:hypothetical protein
MPDKNIDAESFLIKYAHKKGIGIGRPGLSLDDCDIKDIKYPHARFEGIWGDEVRKFFEMSNEEKFLYAHSAERRKSQQALQWGVVFGLIIAWAIVGVYSLLVN